MTNMTFQEFEGNALAQGFDEAVERKWAPLTVVGVHSHPFTAKAVVIQGDMWLTIGSGDTRHLSPGDTFEIDRDVTHDERYGTEGAIYWVARRAGAGSPQS